MSPRRFVFIITLALLSMLITAMHVGAYELKGDIAVEGRFFPNPPLYEGQEHHNASLAFDGELYKEFETGSSITIAPFLRLDSADSKRTHADFREFNFLYLGDRWELKAGISKVAFVGTG